MTLLEGHPEYVNCISCVIGPNTATNPNAHVHGRRQEVPGRAQQVLTIPAEPSEGLSWA